MTQGYNSTLAPWVGGAGVAPGVATVGYASLLALWLGGAAVPAATQAGFYSPLAPWVGGAGAPSTNPQEGYFSLLAPWVGGAGAGGAPTSAGKSHYALYLRQMLVEYYTKEFEVAVKKDVVPGSEPVTPQVAKKGLFKRAVLEPVKQDHIVAMVQRERAARQVEAAHAYLVNLPQEVAQELLSRAVEFRSLVTDFSEFERLHRRAQLDRDLLLLVL